ncbi:DUF2812 domain-containing protein [Bacillus sp. BGMRC 2118]|nr:DUF2812 domain-containing protein [Bacillus sp. BGMRC 2118]
MTTKKVLKVFWAWQDDNEEIWLNEMAKRGWALKSYRFIYTFEKVEETNYVYKLDYKSTKDDDLEEYKALFKDSGWEYVTRYGDWHYFRTIKTEETSPEIYSDVEYKIETYNGLLQNLIGAFLALLIISTLVIFEVIGESFSIGISFFLGGITFITGLCVMKVKQKINRCRE